MINQILLIENDNKLSDALLTYISENNDDTKCVRNVVYNVNTVSSDILILYFKKCQILEFQPTLITFSQYNLLLMCMYKLIKENSLDIKEIHIFSRNEQISDELTDLWRDKRMYLDEVLKYVKIYRVYNHEEPQLLSI